VSLKVCVLGSGSTGNCTYVASDSSAVLVDAGLSGRETAGRLAAVGADLASVRAVCLTHEHDDHISGIPVLFRRTGMALYANTGTIDALERKEKMRGLSWNVFETGAAFTVGDLSIEPFSVPHDSYDPVGFVVSGGGARVAVVTDMGMATELIRQRLRHCRAIVIEANHDVGLLRDSRRPWMLKQRISGRQGHMSNTQAAELIAEIAGPDLACVYLAHLSAECNDPAAALREVSGKVAAAGHAGVRVLLTYPDRPSEIFTAL